MGLEKTVLELASVTGVNGAYFYNGTLFFPVDASEDTAFLNFERALEDQFPRMNVMYCQSGDEVAVDFAEFETPEEIYSPYLGA